MRTIVHGVLHLIAQRKLVITSAAPGRLPYMWVILCLVGYKLVGERLAAFARARKRSDVTRGHMWATGRHVCSADIPKSTWLLLHVISCVA